MQRPVRLTAPAELPVSLEDVKGHLRVSHDDDDTLISALMQAAVDHLDGWSGVLGRCLIEQEWTVSSWAFGYRIMRLPFPDVSEASIVYRDNQDAEQDLEPDQFSVKQDGRGSYLWFEDTFLAPSVFDRPDAVTVTFKAGYGDAESVPQALKQAIFLMIGHWYENREAVSAGVAMQAMPMAVCALIAPYRRLSL